MTADEFPDAEQLVVYWLQHNTAVTGVVAGRVYTASPPNVTRPFVRVSRVGGSPTSKDEDAPRIQIDCWADEAGQATAMDVCRAVVSAVPAFVGKQASSGSWVIGPYVRNGPVWSQDQLTGEPRYWVEIGFNTYREG